MNDANSAAAQIAYGKIERALRRADRTSAEWPMTVRLIDEALSALSKLRDANDAQIEIDEKVKRLVIAARELHDAVDDFESREEQYALDKALEPFSSLIPYSDEPDADEPTALFFWLGADGDDDDGIIRTALPAAAWRKLYDGIDRTPSEEQTLREHFSKLNVSSHALERHIEELHYSEGISARYMKD